MSDTDKAFKPKFCEQGGLVTGSLQATSPKMTMSWKVHVPNLMGEIAKNDQCSVLRQPIRILLDLMGQLAHRAIELQDPVLLGLCCRLTLLEESDPERPGRDADKCQPYIEASEAHEIRYRQDTQSAR